MKTDNEWIVYFKTLHQYMLWRNVTTFRNACYLHKQRYADWSLQDKAASLKLFTIVLNKIHILLHKTFAYQDINDKNSEYYWWNRRIDENFAWIKEQQYEIAKQL